MASNVNGKDDHGVVSEVAQDEPLAPTGSVEKTEFFPTEIELDSHLKTLEHDLNVTEEDLNEAKEIAAQMSTEEVRKLMASVLRTHERDPNFPHSIIERIHAFLSDASVFAADPADPKRHATLMTEMKLEAALITANSPYAEVRAVVDNKDDPATPCSTVRAWAIGVVMVLLLAFVNQLFSIRQPPIVISANVAQLLAFPLGRAWERWVPARRFTLFGQTHSLNPGRFNKKEHMLIAIMANTAQTLPYTKYIVWTQVLPQYFNQQYARSFAYQVLIALSTNFIGYGLAGLTRKFIVYPAYCVWPHSLVTIALNSALHNESNLAVPGPFKRLYSINRYKFFLWTFGAMGVYFWFPNYLFEALTYFSWITWIAPDNFHLNIVTGFKNGAGMFNPWPTFDWNVMLFDNVDPLMVPAFSTFNKVLGMFIWGLVILAVYLTNTWNTGYLPIVTNRVYDHFGKLYNVSRALNDHGLYDHDKYMDYSAAYLGAANTVVYGVFFGMYAATITHVILFHRHEIAMGLKYLWRSIRRRQGADAGVDDGEYQDVHSRLMAAYPEVSEWWYLGTLVLASAFGFAGVTGWPTYTTPGVVPYGVALALVFVIPVGIIRAMTGIEVTLNVLAEFIGGIWVQGNALAMNYFKSFGYVTCAHAVSFANDLKLAHYLKIPPRHTFAAQMVSTLISTFVCTAVLNFQINIPNVCDSENAPMRFYCPGPNTFFTASVLWGTIGPIKVFGPHGQYGALLLGFPVGIVLTVLVWAAVRYTPRRWGYTKYLRQLHPVAIFFGGTNWSPYSFSYAWPAVPIAWLSWIYVKNRYLAFWSKYNFVLSAAFSAGIAISGIVMLFSVQWAEISVSWWGNNQPYIGCESGSAPCRLKTLAKGERFYPWWNGDKIPAP